MCGQEGEDGELDGGRCKPCLSLKTRLYRMFKGDDNLKLEWGCWSKEKRQEFCLANHGQPDLKASFTECASSTDSQSAGIKFLAEGMYRDDFTLKEKYKGR